MVDMVLAYIEYMVALHSPGVLHGMVALHGSTIGSDQGEQFSLGSDSLDDLIEDIFGERASGV